MAFAAFAAIGGSQTENYDVRHVRWGMSVPEVKAAEPKVNLDSDKTSGFEYDSVVGLDTFIQYLFDSQGLSEVRFVPGKGWSTSDEADEFLFAWQSALEKKYGKSYICSGDEKVCHLTTVERLEKARKLYHSDNIRFSVQFSENDRTQVIIHMGFYKSEGKTKYGVYTLFQPVPKDNF